jgi:pimeloyl-ACP methyl ester carboxylesterase
MALEGVIYKTVVMKTPQITYAKGPEGRVAYQTVGDGPLDLVFMPFFGRWNLDIVWEHPPLERFLRRLASFSRLILFNPRGTGISDPIPVGLRPTVEDRMLDARLVLDAVGSGRAAVLAIEAATAVSTLFAATFPERTLALGILNGYASTRRADDYPWGLPPEAFDRFIDALATSWGTGQSLDFLAPDLAKDRSFQEWWARLERLTTSPTTFTVRRTGGGYNATRLAAAIAVGVIL